MTVLLPTLKQLQYLVALQRHEHFGQAAESCFVAQSTISAALSELEILLGVKLVERTRRVVRFTALGHKVANKAAQVLRESEELARIVVQARQPLHGELRLGVIPTIAPFLLPVILPQVRAQWPDLKLYVREETSEAACKSLHRATLDCVLLAMPYACGDVDSALLHEDRLFVAFPPGEAPAGATVDAQAIDASRLLMLEDGHCLKDHALSACNRPELRSEATMVGTSLHTLVQMVRNQLGVTFLPAMAIEAGILLGTNVEIRLLGSENGYRGIALVWRRTSSRAHELALFGETLRTIISEQAGATGRQP